MPPRRRLPDHPTGAQLRAARGLLNLSLTQLSEQTGLALNTLKRAEAVNSLAPITSANAKLLVTVLSAAGVIFIPSEGSLGSGVRLASDNAPIECRRRRTGRPD